MLEPSGMSTKDVTDLMKRLIYGHTPLHMMSFEFFHYLSDLLVSMQTISQYMYFM